MGREYGGQPGVLGCSEGKWVIPACLELESHGPWSSEAVFNTVTEWQTQSLCVQAKAGFVYPVKTATITVFTLKRRIMGLKIYDTLLLPNLRVCCPRISLV